MAQPTLKHITDMDHALRSGPYDATVVVFTDHTDPFPPPLAPSIAKIAEMDAQFGHITLCHHHDQAAGGRLILAPTGPIDRDWDDVRSISDAAEKGMRRAQRAGAVRPALIVTSPANLPGFERVVEVACLGALQGLWEPLEAREHDSAIETVESIGVFAPSLATETLHAVTAMEEGRRLARDLCGTEAERMTPYAFADLAIERLAGTGVTFSIEKSIAVLNREYPLLMSVARASLPVPRHRPCVLRLQWHGGDTTAPHLLFAGKGVTYDTGGADLKTDGHMAGMSRDKGGGAGVAGIVLAAALLKAPVNITAEIGLVRNSIGAECFVTDEIITGHSGKRVRIGNTDAEGRLVLADCLSHLREHAVEASRPYLFTVATLTGHAVIAMGPYAALLDNGPAHAEQMAEKLAAYGTQWGEPMEISTLRREDIQFVDAKTSAADLLSCNSAPSSRTARGHQFPAAFLLRASGLEKHGSRSGRPLPYTHVDIAGSAVSGTDFVFGAPTGSPVVPFITRWCIERNN